MKDEPNFHTLTFFNYTNSLGETQKWACFLLDVWFKDDIFGVPGDKDVGGIATFVVCTSMGFCPVTPGVPAYSLISPVFRKQPLIWEMRKY